MTAGSFISRRIRFKGKLAETAIAISFLVIIIAVAVSAGFRSEIRKGVAAVTGDIILSETGSDYYGENTPVHTSQSYLADIEAVPGVASITPAVYRAGIVKGDGDIHGVMVKGTRTSDTTKLGVSIPSRLARLLDLKVGDPMLTYFVGEKVKVRKFMVTDIYESILDSDESLIVRAGISDMQRLNGWDEDQVSTLELTLDSRSRSSEQIREITREVGSIAAMSATDMDDVLIATASVDKYSQLFDWLDLIDFNVAAILLLMIVVAGFNMISGLLILLFRNISTIGTLKALGMSDKGVAGVFLRVSARTVSLGMAAGNAAGLLFCLVQGTTHLLKLNPENYFVSFVPVDVNIPGILAADAMAFVAIMLLLLIPCLFISKIDPSRTVRTE